MKVLFICPCEYPNNGACTNILKNILGTEAMQNSIDSYSVLCYKVNEEQPFREAQANEEIFRFYVFDNISLIQARNVFKKYPLLFIKYVLIKLKKKIFASIIQKKGYDGFVSRQTNKVLKKINAQQYDVIIPICGDYSIAKGLLDYLRQYSKPKLIVWQVDPYATNKTRPAKYFSVRSEFERILFTRASYIITTDILYKEYQESMAEEYLKKMIVLGFPNLVDRIKMVQEERDNEIINCVFAGDIYSARNPEYVFKTFRELKKSNVEFSIVGSDGSNFPEYQIIFRFMGRKSIEESRAAIDNADALINIGNNAGNQVPSKLFEYMSFGKPIINFYRLDNCPTLNVLSKYPLALNIKENDLDIDLACKQIIQFIHDSKNKKVDFEQLKVTFVEYTPEYFSEELLKLLE